MTVGNLTRGRLRARVAQLVVLIAVAIVALIGVRVPAAGAVDQPVSAAFAHQVP
jgi:hypothetical protein